MPVRATSPTPSLAKARPVIPRTEGGSIDLLRWDSFTLRQAQREMVNQRLPQRDGSLAARGCVLREGGQTIAERTARRPASGDSDAQSAWQTTAVAFPVPHAGLKPSLRCTCVHHFKACDAIQS
jgi:hypothetical protein